MSFRTCGGIVVPKLYKNVIAFTNLCHQFIPASFVEESLRTASAHGVINHFDFIVQKFRKHLPPAFNQSVSFHFVGLRGRISGNKNLYLFIG